MVYHAAVVYLGDQRGYGGEPSGEVRGTCGLSLGVEGGVTSHTDPGTPNGAGTWQDAGGFALRVFGSRSEERDGPCCSSCIELSVGIGCRFGETLVIGLTILVFRHRCFYFQRCRDGATGAGEHQARKGAEVVGGVQVLCTPRPEGRWQWRLRAVRCHRQADPNRPRS